MKKAIDLPVISIIMPVYNAKEYLAMAIDSVLNQTFPDFELIAVNDGSTDGSAALLNEYQKRDPRVHVYHIENAGAANARNVGLSHATGSYIAFMDSDDRLDATYLEVLYHASLTHDADISVCTFYRYLENQLQYSYFILDQSYEYLLWSPREMYENYYNPQNGFNILFAAPWGKLFRKKLIKSLYFPLDKYFEDSFTIYKACLQSNRIVYVNQQLYMYRIRTNSLSTVTWSRERIRDFCEQHEERFALLSVLGITPTRAHINDYLAGLKNCMNQALHQGYMNDYFRIRQKLDTIDTYQSH